MINLRQIVNVTIDRQTRGVQQAGFGVAMALGAHAYFEDRVRFYGSAEEVAVDCGKDSLQYDFAATYFSQNPSPLQLALGRVDLTSITFDIVTAVTGAAYTVVLSGETITYTEMSASPTLGGVRDGLLAAISAAIISESIPHVAATSHSTSSFVITASDAFSVLATTSNLAISEYTESETVTEALNAIIDVENTWYALALLDRDVANVKLACAWVEAQAAASQPKKFVTASSDADIGDAAETDDIASWGKALSYFNCAVMYHNDADTVWPEAALLGTILPRTPGTYTAAYKVLVGIAPSAWTSSQTNAARAKYAIVYEEVGDVNVTIDGKTMGGEFLDIMIGVDWLRARISENVYTKIVNLPKVPYTDSGIGIIEAGVRSVLKIAVDNTLLADDPAPTVTVPKAVDTPTADRVLRFLDGVKFDGRFAGAIHFAGIAGTIAA